MTAQEVDGSFRNLRIDHDGNLMARITHPVSSFGEIEASSKTYRDQLSFIYRMPSILRDVDPGTSIQMLTEGDGSTQQDQTIGLSYGQYFTSSGAGDYFLATSGDSTNFYIWYDVSSGNSDPAPGGAGIQVDITASDEPATVASATVTAIESASSVLFATTITNSSVGDVADINITNMPSNTGYILMTDGTASVAQVQKVAYTAGSTFTSTGAADYFTLTSGTGSSYYVWFNVDAGNSDPSPGGTGISVAISSGGYSFTGSICC